MTINNKNITYNFKYTKKKLYILFLFLRFIKKIFFLIIEHLKIFLICL